MSPLLPVAVYGLEVPPGEIMVPAAMDFPATIHITMAAIDPAQNIEIDDEGNVPTRPRATLKLIKAHFSDVDSDEDDEDDEDDRSLRALLGLGDDEDDDDEDEDDDDEEGEEANGGPSDPAKSKKARRAEAIRKLLEATQDDDDDEDEDKDEDMEEADGGLEGIIEPKANGVKKSKGKGKAVDDEDDDEDDEDDDEDDEDDDDDEDDELDLLDEFVVCTLDPDIHYQQALDITVAERERVFFVVSGNMSVHLTGNYVIHDFEETDDEDEYDLSPDELDEMVGDSDEEYESDELDGIEHIGRIEEIEEDEQEEAPALVSTKGNKGKNKRPAEDADEGLDDMIAKESNAAASEQAKLSKKQLKKLKNNKGEAVEVKDAPKPASKDKETTGTAKSDKKVQFAKNLEQGPTGSREKAKHAESKASVGVKVVQGVTVDDRKIGTGRTVKSGDRVGMRYIGKLQSGKVFDSNKKGAPFSCRIGKGEVIKGWDVGIVGMSVGGERRLTIPANLAYGSKAQPGIPANSTLIFDVKLLEIK